MKNHKKLVSITEFAVELRIRAVVTVLTVVVSTILFRVFFPIYWFDLTRELCYVLLGVGVFHLYCNRVKNR
jgi:N-acyl-L-homoserine lactone synthetase